MTKYENCYEEDCNLRAIYFVAHQKGSGAYKDVKLLCEYHTRSYAINNLENYFKVRLLSYNCPKCGGPVYYDDEIRAIICINNYKGKCGYSRKADYFCEGCYRSSRKKYFLKRLEDEMGVAFRCTHCGHMILDWIVEAKDKGELSKSKYRFKC